MMTPEVSLYLHCFKKLWWTFNSVLILVPILYFISALAYETSSSTQPDREWIIPPSFEHLLPKLSKAAASHYIDNIEKGAFVESQKGVLRFCEEGGLVCDGDRDDIYQSAIWYYYRGGVKISKQEISRMSTAINPRLATFSREFYFFEKDLPTLLIHANFLEAISNDTNQANYLPKSVVRALMATTQNFSNGAAALDVLNLLHISSNSEMGKTVIGTLNACSPENMVKRAVEGEVRSCLYSVEDLMDFAESSLHLTEEDSRQIKMEIVESDPFEATSTLNESFKVVSVQLKGDENSASLNCHTLGFPFRVNMCHMLPNTKVYLTTLESIERPGCIIKHSAICHMETSHFGADQVSFLALETKPGQSEICHWTEVGAFAVVQTKV